MMRALLLTALLCAGPAAAIDLLDIYREAKVSDTQVAIAKARYRAAQERVPQALAGVQPVAGVAAIGAGIDSDDHARNWRPPLRPPQ